MKNLAVPRPAGKIFSLFSKKYLQIYACRAIITNDKGVKKGVQDMESARIFCTLFLFAIQGCQNLKEFPGKELSGNAAELTAVVIGNKYRKQRVEEETKHVLR